MELFTTVNVQNLLWTRLPVKPPPGLENLIHDTNVLFDKSYTPWVFRSLKKNAIPKKIGFIQFAQNDTLPDTMSVRPEVIPDLVTSAPWHIFTQNPHLLNYLYTHLSNLEAVTAFIKPGGNLSFQRHLLFPTPPARFEEVESPEEEPIQRSYVIRKVPAKSLTLSTATWGSKKTVETRIGEDWASLTISGTLIGIRDGENLYLLEERELPDRADMIRDYNGLKRNNTNITFLSAQNLGELINLKFGGSVD